MRLDTDSNFPCEFQIDPFKNLDEKDVKYSFILSDHEGLPTMPTLWNTIKEWTRKSLVKLNSKNNSMLSFITDDNGNNLNSNLCIFYNNFEMASFSLFRNETYLDYFNYLDKTGGFFYERWVNKNRILFFFYFVLFASKISKFLSSRPLIKDFRLPVDFV